MLSPLQLVDQFNRIERGLPDDWAEARLLLTVADEARTERAAALLGPANPGRLGNKIRFSVARGGTGLLPEGARRLLRRLVQEGIDGKLELVGMQESARQEVKRHEALRAQWERALAALPADWSDVYAEVGLDSTDYLERAALLLAPLNPAHFSVGGTSRFPRTPSTGPLRGRALRAGFRFRCAHHFGYGVAPEMAARCFERCDEEGITGAIEILRVLSDTQPVGTQGPVWLVGGRTV